MASFGSSQQEKKENSQKLLLIRMSALLFSIYFFLFESFPLSVKKKKLPSQITQPFLFGT